MNANPPRRSAKSRPLTGVLTTAGRREIVVVTAHDKRLVINVEADISAMPLTRVRRDAGLNLRRTDKSDWQIRLDDVPPESWVFDLPLARPMRLGRRLLLIGLALLALLAAGLWLGRDRVVQLAAPLLPHHVTDQIGRTYLAQLGRQCDGGPGSAALARLTARLLPAQGLPEPVSVTVVDNPEINAVALPGGHVALMRGILDQAQSPDEIAAVLAHEIEHVAFQHPNQLLLKDSGPAVIARTLGSDAGDIANLTVLKQGSKAAEAEADGGAIALLGAADVSTRAAADFFDRQMRATGSDGFSSSHPSDAERARRFADAARRGTTPALSPADWQALKAICSPPA